MTWKVTVTQSTNFWLGYAFYVLLGMFLVLLGIEIVDRQQEKADRVARLYEEVVYRYPRGERAIAKTDLDTDVISRNHALSSMDGAWGGDTYLYPEFSGRSMYVLLWELRNLGEPIDGKLIHYAKCESVDDLHQAVYLLQVLVMKL